MAKVHCYFGVENLAFNDSQKSILSEGLRQLGPASHNQPACLCHWRKRLDGDACIFEALFDEDDLTVTEFKGRLAALFDIDPKDISHTTSQQSFAGGTTLVVTFSYSDIDYLRMALFGGQGVEWMESGNECRGYLAVNREEWESELV